MGQTEWNTLGPTFTPSAGLTTGQTMSTEDTSPSTTDRSASLDMTLNVFDDIWTKLMMLAKQLRDTMQFYNQKKQMLGWGLEINTLDTRKEAIEKNYSASWRAAIGSIAGGALTAGFCVKGGEVGSILGQGAAQLTSGVFNWAAGSETRQADRERAVADLQDKGAMAYAKTLNETLDKARDIMQQMMGLGQTLVEVLSTILRALAR